MSKIALCALLVILSLAKHANADCQRYTAPYPFPNRPQTWGRNDSGPIVDGGFVDSKRPKGGVFDVVHGIDVAAGNAVNYSKFRDCGGIVAFVRINHSNTKTGQVPGPIDEQFASHVRDFVDHGVSIIPYFYLRLPVSLKRLSDLNKPLSDQELQSTRDKYFQFGQQMARVFLQYSEKLSSPGQPSVPENTVAGLRAKFVALDVEEQPVGANSPLSQTNYGRLYATTVCAWVQTVQQKYPDFVPILYTFPAIYGDYLQYALPKDNACLQGLPVWISRTYPNGWEAIHDINSANCAKRNNSVCTTDRYVKLLCEVQSGNRCIIHQYTHRGTPFALGSPENGIPPHFDFDRFYISKVITTNTTPQYVRVEDSFKQH